MRTWQLSARRVEIFLEKIRLYGGQAFDSVEAYFEAKKTFYELILRDEDSTTFLVGSEEVSLDVRQHSHTFSQTSPFDTRTPRSSSLDTS